jgi:hypothetical protein
MVRGTSLCLVRSRLRSSPRWAVREVPVNGVLIGGQEWLQRNGLDRASFASRSEALSTVLAHHATDPAPAMPSLVPLRRKGAGYIGADGTRISRDGKQWRCWTTDRGNYQVRTLIQAAHTIAFWQAYGNN